MLRPAADLTRDARRKPALGTGTAPGAEPRDPAAMTVPSDRGGWPGEATLKMLI